MHLEDLNLELIPLTKDTIIVHLGEKTEGIEQDQPQTSRYNQVSQDPSAG